MIDPDGERGNGFGFESGGRRSDGVVACAEERGVEVAATVGDEFADFAGGQVAERNPGAGNDGAGGVDGGAGESAGGDLGDEGGSRGEGK